MREAGRGEREDIRYNSGTRGTGLEGTRLAEKETSEEIVERTRSEVGHLLDVVFGERRSMGDETVSNRSLIVVRE